jgi:hypothetical protein
MPFTDYFYDRFVSKGFGSLEKQLLRPFPDELRSFCVQQFVLNTVFRTPFAEKVRARSFNVIRRTLNAIEEYELARTSYETIFPNKTVGAYLRALHHFESCVTELFQAYELFLGIIGKEFPEKAATTGPEEVLSRLDRIYNTAKHTEHMLIRAQHFEEGDTLAVWISNVGLTSKSYTLTFGELHESLCGIANAAAMLANGGQQAAAEPVRKSA